MCYSDGHMCLDSLDCGLSFLLSVFEPEVNGKRTNESIYVIGYPTEYNAMFSVKIQWPIFMKVIGLCHLHEHRIQYYNNSTASFRTRFVFLHNIEINPGPAQPIAARKLECLYLNFRSVCGMVRDLEAMESTNAHDPIAITETLLKPLINDFEFFQFNLYQIRQRDG